MKPRPFLRPSVGLIQRPTRRQAATRDLAQHTDKWKPRPLVRQRDSPIQRPVRRRAATRDLGQYRDDWRLLTLHRSHSLAGQKHRRLLQTARRCVVATKASKRLTAARLGADHQKNDFLSLAGFPNGQY